MSIHNSIFHLILALNTKKQLSGSFLSIGRQSIYMTKKSFQDLIKIYSYKQGIEKLNKLSFENYKDFTRNSKKSLMSDIEFMKIFPKLKYETLDKSNYENADNILDLNSSPTNKRFKKQYDYIYDGGSLDNIFSPSNAIINLNKMLKKNGVIIHANVGTIFPGAFCSFSCEWFFSYYSMNKFKNVQVYLGVPIDYNWPNPTYAFYNFSPYFSRKKNYNPLYNSKFSKFASAASAVFCVAQKSSTSTFNKMPIQSHYLEKKSFDWRKNFKKYNKKTLNLKLFKQNKFKDIKPLNSNHYRYLGIIK